MGSPVLMNSPRSHLADELLKLALVYPPVAVLYARTASAISLSKTMVFMP